jgi:glycosyltransferase involved in cell wall biosynthesis
MKICLVGRFFDLRNGGIGRFSTEMLNGLKGRGYEIIPVSTKRHGTAGHVVYSFFDLALRLPRGCDVYHCLTPMEAIYAPKKRSVVTFHDFIPWLNVNNTDTHYVQGSMRLAKSLLSKEIFKTAAKIAGRCSLIACNSTQTRKEVIELLGVSESRVSVVRFGISPGLEPQEKKDGIFRMGTLSYLDPRKRIDLLIQAFLAANMDGELVIGGTGTDEARLKKLANEDKRIKFAGFVPEERQAEFYNSLDLFVFPSKIEGYGLPIVEAMACKKPVVVLRDSIMPEEVKVNCTVVESLTEFLKDPRPLEKIEAGYAFARLHDWNTCIDEYLKLYERLAG